MQKKLVYILVILILLAGVWLLKQELDKRPKQTGPGQESAIKAEPTFLVGQISKLKDNKVYFTVSVPNLNTSGKPVVVYEDRVAVVSALTKIVIQGSSKNKQVQVAGGNPADLKTGMQIAVYYYPENALKGEILAEKIQVIK